MTWRVARALDQLLAQLNALAPNRSRASDGSIGDAAHQSQGSASDHNPWFVLGGQALVTARDFTHDPAAGLDCDKLAAALIASRDPRIKYLIWRGRICDSRAQFNPWTWQPSSGHYQHLHLSVMDNASADDTRPWSLPGLTLEDELASSDEILAGIQDIRTNLSIRYRNSGKTDSSGDVLDRLGWMFPGVDNQWISDHGGIAPGTLTNAIASTYRFVFEQLAPRLSAMAAVMAQIAEDDTTTVTLTAEQLAALKDNNAEALREGMAALGAQLDTGIERLAGLLAEHTGQDRTAVLAALNEFYGRAVTKEN